MKTKPISQACSEALSKMGIPLFRKLRGAELDDTIYSWRVRRYEYKKPEKAKSKKLSFAPPPLSVAQVEVLKEFEKVQEGVGSSAQGIGTSIASLRSLARKEYITGGDDKTTREEEVWMLKED